jgi:CheY-like chemotaxis protein
VLDQRLLYLHRDERLVLDDEDARAGEGEAALDLFQAWTPDLVVTDILLPGMTGIELMASVRGGGLR